MVPCLLALCGSAGVVAVHCLLRAGSATRPVPAQPLTIEASWVWFFAALLSTLFALVQYFNGAEGLAPWITPASLGEAYANLRQRNHFASLTNIGMAALLWQASRYQHHRVWPMAAAVLLAAGNAASASRTGLAQLVLLLVLTAVWTRQDGGWRNAGARRVLVSAVLAYCTAAIVLPLLLGAHDPAVGIAARIVDTHTGCASRLTLWTNVLPLIAQKPWLGWGWGELGYAHFITLYPGARFCDIVDNAHNLPLHLAVELGVPLALAVCFVGVWLVWRAKPWRETDASRQMAWAVLALIMLHSLVEYPLWYGPFQMTVGLCIWLLWRPADAAVVGQKYKHFRPSALVNWALFATVFIACIGYAAWDYYRVSQIYLAPVQRAPAYRDNTLEKISGTWLFKNQVDFAELSITPLTPATAERINTLAKSLLHFSAEPSVVQKLVESSVMLGRDDEALYYLVRFRAAFPQQHANWARSKSYGW